MSSSQTASLRSIVFNLYWENPEVQELRATRQDVAGIPQMTYGGAWGRR